MFFLSLVLATILYAQNLVFTAMGDSGKDIPGQAKVAKALEEVCKKEKCEFNLQLGDNFYSMGIDSMEDPAFYNKFEKYYSHLDFPFHVVLGNHDYGRLGKNYKRGVYQLEYAKINPQFHMPHYFYSYEKEDVLFLALDTQKIINGDTGKDQAKMIQEAISKSNAKWVIAYGHHPYLSNGSHGNAGNYEGVKWPPRISGSHFKKFMDKNVCPYVNAYYSGHDHSLQILPGTEECNINLVVSGTAASVTKIKDRNPSYFSGANLGFVLTKVYRERLLLEVYNEKAKIMHVHEIR